MVDVLRLEASSDQSVIDKIENKRAEKTMLRSSALVVGLLSCTAASAQVPLSQYADKDGYVDVQKLTCAELAGTFQEDADMLAAWYSGWYNGLAKAHRAKIGRVKDDQHEVIVYCKANPKVTIIKAIDAILKQKK